MNAQPLAALAADAASILAREPRSQPVTDLAARIAWVVGLLLFVALLYWLMRQGWKWRGTLQGDLPAPQSAPSPEEPGETLLTAAGRYHGSTSAGQWLDRIVAHGLGTRSRAEVTLTAAGVHVQRPAARDFFIPAARLRGARLEKGIAGKVFIEGGLLVVTWQLGERLIDSGFRFDRAAEHAAWAERLGAMASGDSGVAVPHDPAVTPERDT